MTGLQDPTGRVFRLHMDGRVDVLLRNCPSPNGLVVNKAETGSFVAMTRDNSVWHAPLYPDGSVQRTVRFSS
jgi:gluconolactonase